VNDFLSNLRATWDKLSRTQRLATVGSFFGVLIVIAMLAAFYSREDYVPLFDYIRDRREALAVESKLKELNIPARSSDGGHVVLVPRSMRESAHLALAEANSLPDAVLSYREILDDNQSFGLTEKELDVRINRSREGSIAKTIMLFRNISHAQVHIDKAKDSLFVQDQKETRVSVLVTPSNPLEPIPGAQVQTILNLVTNAISGLKKENVFITDDKGGDLLGMVKEKDKKLDQSELTIRKERELTRKAVSALSEIYGEKNVNVAVTLELDFDSVDEESKELAPPVDGEEQGVKISEELRETESRTTDPKAVPGTQTNIPGYQAPENTLSASKSREQRINYAYKQKQRTVKRATGQIRRMSVMVVINLDALPEMTLSDEIRQGVSDLVASATGLDLKNRADKISVTAFTFNKLRFEREQKNESDIRAFQSSVFATGVFCAMMATMFMLGRRVLSKRRAYRQQLLRKAQEAIEEQSQNKEDVLTMEQREKNERERFLMEMAREDPEQLVKIIRTLMFDENYY